MGRAAATGMAALVGIFAGALGQAEPAAERVTIRNRSGADLHGIHLTQAEEGSWGRNLLVGGPLKKGRAAVLEDPPCEEQDVKLVDRSGRVCVVEGVHLCSTDSAWELDGSDILGCEPFGR